MDENILFSYELKDAWFLPITGVDVYKTGEVRCMTDDKDATSILDEKALAEIENVIESHPELFEYESPEIATPSILDGGQQYLLLWRKGWRKHRTCHAQYLDTARKRIRRHRDLHCL